MIAIVSILIALALLVLTVYGLHKHQTREVEISAHRSLPLPPIGDEFNGNIEVAGQSAANNSETARSSVKREPVKNGDPLSEQGSGSGWQDELAELKRSGDILGALALCEHEFPLWGAYNQACIVLRTQLKSTELSPAQRENLLSQLYRTAAIAELLHDKSPEYHRLSLNQLKNLKLQQADELEMPYQNLGYAHLRLIRKSDIKMMQSCWGRPANHLSPRKLHRTWWEQVTSQLA